MSSVKGYSIIEGCIRQATMNPIKKEYKISLGLTDEEIADLKKDIKPSIGSLIKE